MIRTLAIDDEPLALQQLAAYKLSRAVEITQGAYERYLSR